MRLGFNTNKHNLIMRIALAGSVNSSAKTLHALIRHDMNIVGVLGLNAEKSAKVSGFVSMEEIAGSNNIPFVGFDRINAEMVIQVVKDWQPDLLFVVGLSQLVHAELLYIPKRGCVGFHPTWLPEGRGRAPIAWLTIEGRQGAATFFLLELGADSGPILAQEPFYVGPDDFAEDVTISMETAIDKALDQWLPLLKAGYWNPRPQDDSKATYYGKRSPEDGLIDWNQNANMIYDLIRASSNPHPGAFTYCNGEPLIIWKAKLESLKQIQGVTGSILLNSETDGWLIQTGTGCLWVRPEDLTGEGKSQIRVGTKLGFSLEVEIYRLTKRVLMLENQLAKILLNEYISNSSTPR